MTLTKADLAQAIVDGLGLNAREAKDMVEAFFTELIESLERGEEVKLAGFGAFNLRAKSERPGRNPKTGQEVPVSARRVVTFHPSGVLKDAVIASPTLAMGEALAA